MRRPSPLIRVAALAMAVTAAAGSAALPVRGADSPAGAVDAVLDALVAGPTDGVDAGSVLDGLVCAERRGGPEPVLDLAGAVGGGVADAARLLEGAAITIDDRLVTVLDESTDAASVAVDGSLRVAPDADVARGWVRAGLEAAGQPASDAVVDRFLADLLATFTADVPIATAVSVVREDGAWLLCDVIRTGLVLDPEASPAPIAGALCDLMTVEELNAATGYAFVTATPFEDGCAWDSAVAAGYHTIGVWRESGTLDEIRAVWMRGRELTVDGRPAWATSSGTWVDLGDGLLAVLPHLEGATVAEPMDAITFARTVAELVVPRLP